MILRSRVNESDRGEYMSRPSYSYTRGAHRINCARKARNEEPRDRQGILSRRENQVEIEFVRASQ